VEQTGGAEMTIRIATIGLALALAFGVTASAQDARTKAAEAALKRGDMPAAKAGWEAAAAAGDTKAMEWLGWAHHNAPAPWPHDVAQGRRWYERCSKAGSAGCSYLLALQLRSGTKHAKDLPAAIALLRKAAAAGYAEAMTVLGLVYERGEGVPVNRETAHAWYQKAAGAGDRDSMFNLGLDYRDGRGTAVDIGQARFWLQKAADAGDTDAPRLLAALAARAPQALAATQAIETTPASDPVAAEALVKQAQNTPFEQAAQRRALYEQAAALGSVYARGVLGANYCRGDGVAKDERRCHSVYLLLAEEGQALYQRLVGLQYINGVGVPVDYDAARYWLEKASNGGDSMAMMYVGMIYDPASKMIPNQELAAIWYQLAHEKGNNIASGWLEQRGLLKLPANQQAFIDRIESQGPDRTDAAKFGYDVAVYCQYGGKRCNQLRGDAYRFQERQNAAAESANMQRLWHIYRRETVDPSIRTRCLAQARETLHKATYGQQTWYYSADSC